MDIPENQNDIYLAARDTLEKLLELMDLAATVELSEEFTSVDDDGNLSSLGLNILGEDLGILIGRRGQTIVSLQHILRLISNCKMHSRLPIVLDVEGYKQRRCEGLRTLAGKLAEQVKARRIPFTMEPMPAFERRVIHMALATHPDVVTESVGEGDMRKVIISPVKPRDY